MSDPVRPSGLRTVVLVLSLCLNVVLIAVIVVGLTRAVQSGFIAQPGGQLAPGAIARALAPERQAQVRDISTEHGDAMRDARRAARRARVEAFRVFASPAYTPDAFTKALEDVRQADSKLEEEAILLLRDTVNNLTPQERQTVIDRARRGANRPWYRRLLQPTPKGQPQG